MSRKDILLRAAYDLIKRSTQSHYVQAVHETSVFYDDANCGGLCLMEDIETELDLEPNTQPIKLRDEQP